MKPILLFALGLWAALSSHQKPTDLRWDTPIQCSACGEWNVAREPFRIFGNTYYVGVAGLSSVLIAGDAGLVLLDGALPQSAPLIDASIRKLGFRTSDIRLIVNSHAHYDHAGGIAALARFSRAVVAASPDGGRALVRGEPTPDDPQYGFGRTVNQFPRVRTVKAVRDGEVLRAGDIAITAHLTPGHTPGSTTWTWRSCEGQRCLDVVYADSLNAVSAAGFRFTDAGLVDLFRQSIAKVASLPCDVVVSVHPVFTDVDGKRKRAVQGDRDAFVDRQGCRSYAAAAAKRLEARVAEEHGSRRAQP